MFLFYYRLILKISLAPLKVYEKIDGILASNFHAPLISDSYSSVFGSCLRNHEFSGRKFTFSPKHWVFPKKAVSEKYLNFLRSKSENWICICELTLENLPGYIALITMKSIGYREIIFRKLSKNMILVAYLKAKNETWFNW